MYISPCAITHDNMQVLSLCNLFEQMSRSHESPGFMLKAEAIFAVVVIDQEGLCGRTDRQTTDVLYFLPVSKTAQMCQETVFDPKP